MNSTYSTLLESHLALLPCLLENGTVDHSSPAVGIYERKQKVKKEKTRLRPRKNKKPITARKKRKHALDQESKIQEKTITTKKKESRK